jgi:hypothetical protein
VASTPRSERGEVGSIPAPGAVRRPGTPTGRAARLKPGRVWVQLPPWVLDAEETRLGRQPDDHCRSERQMLRVRLPPEPLRSAEYANRQSGQAQTLVIVCGFDSRLCDCNHASAGHWRAQVAVTHPHRCAGSTPARRTDNWPVRLSVQDPGFSRRQEGFDSPTGCSL